ncbi:sugar transferase [Pedobacter psychrodurus]|uniref:sugar transferase n=1 Tax=Pedobacter psychrodurus TaxID=2530456 RepID=UPI00292E6B95|nr:sugar transferase [Pedobacter psychrodurus]
MQSTEDPGNGTIKGDVTQVVYTGQDFLNDLLPELQRHFKVETQKEIRKLDEYIAGQTLLSLPDAILIEVDEDGECYRFVERLKLNSLLREIVIIFLSGPEDKKASLMAQVLNVGDLYVFPIPANDLCNRIKFLIRLRSFQPRVTSAAVSKVKTDFPLKKRLFDICISCFAFILLIPLFLLIALMIRMESKGPIIYRSKRVGAGYKIFDFFKFRSMRHQSSDDLLKLSQLNQYIPAEGTTATFIKIKNDPRVTKIGAFIRKYSLDELPQLLNVIKGDMSLVGNRPLPLYEAKALTSDEWALRFLAPAGLTGLWQVSRRGNREMSERERKKLDNFYAKKYSLRFDVAILIATFSAMRQKENV